MHPHQKDRISYLLRLWRNAAISDPAWHASLENPLTGERKGFAGIEEMADFLETVTLALDVEANTKEDENPLEEQ